MSGAVPEAMSDARLEEIRALWDHLDVDPYKRSAIFEAATETLLDEVDRLRRLYERREPLSERHGPQRDGSDGGDYVVNP